MNAPEYSCAHVDQLLCDYLDGTLPREQMSAFERHVAQCPACAQAVASQRLALDFIARTETVQPPRELLTRILHQLPAAQRDGQPARGIWAKLRGLLAPTLEPRFVMGMAMTVLSFSMLGRFGGPKRNLTPEDLNPLAIVTSIDDKVHRMWNGVVKYYESLRLVYEIQTQWRAWKAEGEELSKQETAPPTAQE